MVCVYVCVRVCMCVWGEGHSAVFAPAFALPPVCLVHRAAQVLFLAVFTMTVAQNQQNLILAVYFAFAVGALMFPSMCGPRVVFGLCMFSVTTVTLSMLYQVGS